MKKIIKLRTLDDQIFEVEEAVILQSQTIKLLIEDINCSNDVIPLHNVNGNILAKVIEYCTKHANDDNNESSTDDDDLKTWDDNFIKVDQKTLFDMILAANYLEIKSLLDLACKSVADMIKGKTPEEIRKTFHIKNDFTPEEEAEIRREHQWAFE